LKVWFVAVIAVIQSLLLAAHLFVYHTLIAFWRPLSTTATLALRDVILVLAFSFVTASLLGFNSSNRAITLFYRIAAVWMGFFNFFFWAACLCRITDWVTALVGLQANRPTIAAVFFGLAVLVGVYGLVNARLIRIRRIPVQLPGLPESWRGRTALVASDLHLGHVNGPGFSRRIAALAARLNPDIIFIPGDLFDGGKANAARLAEPFRALTPPFGSYFSTGNHDEFGHVELYAEVLTGVGIRVLTNEKVTVDGLQIAGVSNGDAGHPVRLRATLESLQLIPGKASILLNHIPSNLNEVEQAGISLQLSGHTHGGQMIPFTWLTHRVFGRFTYGLQRWGAMQVYTSSGVGTWGPPMRVGSRPEIVLFTFV
jgi:predicted MPP superfamily phosphohydrolase